MHMNIRELLNENLMEIGAEISSKDAALERLIELQKEGGAIRNPIALRREITARETRASSAVSSRIAIADVMHSGSARTAVSVLTLRKGVEYGAPDKRPVKLIFMITGRSGTQEHKEAKERLLRLLSDPGFSARLCAAESKEEFIELIKEREKSKFDR